MTETTEAARSGAKTGVLVLAFAVAILIAEGALRLLWDNPFGTESVRMIVELQTQSKNVNRRIDRSRIDKKNPVIPFRTNARGYIEPAIRFDKPVYTVVFLGGSTTECLFVSEKHRFPARASFLLEEKGLKVNSLNMGVSGNDSQQSINNLLNFVVTDKPDVAVLMEAANDIGHLRRMGGYEFAMGNSPTLATLGRLLFTKASAYSSVLGLIRHTKFLLANKETMDRARQTGNDLDLNKRKSELPVEKFTQRLRTFIGISRAFRITPVLMTQPSDAYRNELTPGWVDQSDQAAFNQAIRDVAIEEHAELIDLVAFLNSKDTSIGSSASPIFYDGIHVTDYGSDLYALHISARLLQILRDR
jgi:lysophospholipase L1-like esterase